MRKPKAPAPINLPYASTVASFYGDQGAVQGNSFLGRLFKGRGTDVKVQGNPGRASGSSPMFNVLAGMMGMGSGVETKVQSGAPAAKPANKTSFLSGMVGAK